MAVVNTGIVLRTITGVHDANFVHPLGDELISNGGFSSGSTDWTLGTGWSISSGAAVGLSSSDILYQDINSVVGKVYEIKIDVVVDSGSLRVFLGGLVDTIFSTGSFKIQFSPTNTNPLYLTGLSFTGSIDNVSVKEMLVNRESTATNTGIVERSIVGFNDSDIPVWKGSESTSVVNNTGIVERPITGVNDSDPMFPDNTISNIVNIAGLISSLIADLKARATTFENEDATKEILINLQNC